MEEELLRKNNSNSCDVIIVGQGIAGSVLALSYIKQGYTVKLISNNSLSQSSRVAAGIWNPVVFKRLAKSWLADDLVPHLKSFYQWAETFLQTKFMYEMPIIKAFSEEQEKIFWLKKAETDNSFLEPTIHSDFKIDKNTSIESFSKVLQSGYIDLPIFLSVTQTYFQKNNQFIDETFDYSLLKSNELGISYKGIEAKRIVFCEGYELIKNPLFNWVPLKPAKGEILTIHCPDFLWNDAIINKGFFILPLGNDVYKVGATYEWLELNDLPTEKRKVELCHKLESLITVPYKIIKHQAGVRPSSNDRRPVLGTHPVISNYHVFNGLGTKGVMLAPYFTKHLINHLEKQDELLDDVNVKRFFEK